MNLISLFITSFLTENIVLSKFLGVCPFVGISSKEENAVGMGISVMIIVTVSSMLTYLVNYFILVPTNTTYLLTLMFMLLIASLVQILDIVTKKLIPKLHKALGVYLPLITTNCAVLGICLLNINNDYNFIEMLVFSIGSSLGFSLILYVFSSIRERLDQTDGIKSFKGVPIALITIAIIALVFSRYIGL